VERRYWDAPNLLWARVGLEEPGGGGRHVVEALLDTGAERCTVPTWLSAKLQLQVVDQQEVILAGGTSAGERDVVECTVSCDDVGAFRLPVLVFGDVVTLGMDWFNLVHTTYGYSAAEQCWVLRIQPAPLAGS
jgi:predicted aspartyl protease